MSLIKCPFCNKEISSSLDECPNCKKIIKKKDIFESGNTIDFRYQDEPIYKAAKVNFYATLGIVISVLLLFFGILLLISMEYVIGGIILSIGVILTIISSIYLYISKKMRLKAEE